MDTLRLKLIDRLQYRIAELHENMKHVIGWSTLKIHVAGAILPAANINDGHYANMSDMELVLALESVSVRLGQLSQN